MNRKRLTLHSAKPAMQKPPPTTRKGLLAGTAKSFSSLNSFSIPAAMSFYSDAQANNLINVILAELPGMIAVAVVDIDTGMSLASFSNTSSFDADTAAANHTEVIKQQRAATVAMKLEGDRVEDVFVSLEQDLRTRRQQDRDKGVFQLLTEKFRPGFEVGLIDGLPQGARVLGQ